MKLWEYVMQVQPEVMRRQMKLKERRLCLQVPWWVIDEEARAEW
jgi:hypothetical protein